MRLIHVIDVVLVLHRLPIMLVFEYLGQDALRAGRHTRMIDRAVSAILYAHAAAMHSVELVLHACASW